MSQAIEDGVLVEVSCGAVNRRFMPDKDGWRQSTYKGKEQWLVPNEVMGLTLMFSDDY
jgi:hypothetical protein